MKKIYVCGPTVYSSPHIGNMRPILTFDIYIRALKALGQEVKFVHNITDIDDKIIAKAQELNVSEKEISDKYTQEYKQLLKDFNVETVTDMPSVLENIDNIVKFVSRLIDKGFAYEANGTVYFDTSKLDSYGSISNRKLDEMQYEMGENKKHPADFALWKSTNVGVQFDSPWSQGRPGWHTECALFIEKHFNNETIDIHGGGIDLLFPHHENEAAQFKALNNKDMVSEWKHMGHLSLDGEKMSKSLGNIFEAKQFIIEEGADTLRYIYLTSSVSSPLNISEELINSAKSQISKWTKIYNQAQLFTNVNDEDLMSSSIAQHISDWKFAEANKEINNLVKEFTNNKTTLNANKIISTFKLLGFAFVNTKISEDTKQKYSEWNKLREEGKYDLADKLRDELVKLNLI